MHHPNSVLETHSKDHGFKVRSCSTEERKKIAQRNLSIINKSEEMRNHFSSQNVFLKSLDVITNLILILIFAVKEIILLVFDNLVLCPIALASSCRNCPAFKICPGKRILGDFRTKP